MRKILVSIILLMIIITCFVFTTRLTHENPYGSQQMEVETPPSVDIYPVTTKEFIKGYDDAQQGIIIGTIKWIFSNEYRQGHNLGTHDKIKNIKRYTKD